jgi:general secretion pathway protein A
MYRDYFGFKKNPFSIAPDPHFLYMSGRHREALAHLLYGVNSDGGFVLVTGEVGAGKTTICRCLLEQIPQDVDVAFILNPKVTTLELLATICDEFGLSYPEGNSSIKLFVDIINHFLLDAFSKGRRAVLIIDEAQGMDINVLEQIRLLTNLETNERKLLQIIMLGQPEFQRILLMPELRQFAQRITARYHLDSLSPQEMTAYVSHRLAVAGVDEQLFPPATLRTLFRLSGGVPRLINVICERALLGAYVQEDKIVKKSTLKRAAREVLGDFQGHRSRTMAPFLWAFAGAAFLAAGVVFGLGYYQKAGLEYTAPLDERSENFLAPQAQADIGADVSAAAPDPDGLSSLTWPDSQPITLSKIMAFQSLFDLWGIAYSSQEYGDACPYAAQNGLRCLFKRGSLGSLRRYNRPAVLTLYDDNGQTFYATLAALEKETAFFMVGLEKRTVPVKELESRWLGEFTLLWQAPAEYQGGFQLGDSGPAVSWLKQNLAQVQGREFHPEGNSVFDEVDSRHIREFQEAEGLEPDGIPGSQTLIVLNSVMGKAPLLEQSVKDD